MDRGSVSVLGNPQVCILVNLLSAEFLLSLVTSCLYQQKRRQALGGLCKCFMRILNAGVVEGRALSVAIHVTG